jgi:medium-chain acyl-[acyl-carrier-protein] hydrolase
MPVTSWFPQSLKRDNLSSRLFCLPHAGAGAAVFRKWQDQVDPSIEIVPVQLPGRESRHAEKLEESISSLAGMLVEPVIEKADDQPYAIFGHSMGALLAYELSQELAAKGRPPSLLVVSGQAAPHAYHVRWPVRNLSNQELIEYLGELDGIEAELLANPALLEFYLPVVRADFAACETYRYVQRPPLTAHLIVLGGAADPVAPPAELGRWSELTSDETVIRIFQGGHFFVFEHLATVLSMISDTLLSKSSVFSG